MVTPRQGESEEVWGEHKGGITVRAPDHALVDGGLLEGGDDLSPEPTSEQGRAASRSWVTNLSASLVGFTRELTRLPARRR